MYRIEISGGIATGKTTLADRLREKCGLDVFFEKFREVPFWQECYDSEGRQYVFPKNIGFLLFHAHSLVEAKTLGKPSVCDFAYFQDLAYADLSPQDLPILTSVSERLIEGLPSPAAIIDLSCPSDIQLQRIRDRNRLPEQAIDASFLRRLRGAIDARRDALKVPLIEIDSHAINFTKEHDPDGVEVCKIWQHVRSAMKMLGSLPA